MRCLYEKMLTYDDVLIITCLCVMIHLYDNKVTCYNFYDAMFTYDDMYTCDDVFM